MLASSTKEEGGNISNSEMGSEVILDSSSPLTLSSKTRLSKLAAFSNLSNQVKESMFEAPKVNPYHLDKHLSATSHARGRPKYMRIAWIRLYRPITSLKVKNSKLKIGI